MNNSILIIIGIILYLIIGALSYIMLPVLKKYDLASYDSQENAIDCLFWIIMIFVIIIKFIFTKICVILNKLQDKVDHLINKQDQINEAKSTYRHIEMHDSGDKK